LCIELQDGGRYIPAILLTGLGWLCTALAVMLGAPFWFDVLNKVMVIRSTVKPHEKSKEEASEDRQLPTTVASQAVMPTGMPMAFAQESSPPPPRAVSAPSPRDAETNIDGCDVPMSDAEPTADEDLPAAEGGVAP
jgi:hypothetical protein